MIACNARGLFFSLFFIFTSVSIKASSYIGTDLCFTHLIENKIQNTTADAMPNFNVFYLLPINNNFVYIFDIHYQWNLFSGGYLGALKFKSDFGLKQETFRTLTTEYIGIAPTWLSIKREYTETSGDYSYNRLTEYHKYTKNSLAFDWIFGVRQIFGKNRFFSFGWTAEYSFLVPFSSISSFFNDSQIGLHCVKAGFSFSFQSSSKNS